MKKYLLALSVAALGLAPAWGDDNPMVGTWRASNGYRVHVPQGSSSFQLVFEDHQHKKVTHPAQWVTKGHEFSWTDKQGISHKATFDSKYKSPRIKDLNSAYPTSPAYWYKVP